MEFFSCQNPTFRDGKVWPGSGSAWIHIGLAPWIRIKVKSWIRIRTETSADPKHCWWRHIFITGRRLRRRKISKQKKDETRADDSNETRSKWRNKVWTGLKWRHIWTTKQGLSSGIYGMRKKIEPTDVNNKTRYNAKSRQQHMCNPRINNESGWGVGGGGSY